VPGNEIKVTIGVEDFTIVCHGARCDDDVNCWEDQSSPAEAPSEARGLLPNFLGQRELVEFTEALLQESVVGFIAGPREHLDANQGVRGNALFFSKLNEGVRNFVSGVEKELNPGRGIDDH